MVSRSFKQTLAGRANHDVLLEARVRGLFLGKQDVRHRVLGEVRVVCGSPLERSLEQDVADARHDRILRLPSLERVEEPPAMLADLVDVQQDRLEEGPDALGCDDRRVCGDERLDEVLRSGQQCA